MGRVSSTRIGESKKGDTLFQLSGWLAAGALVVALVLPMVALAVTGVGDLGALRSPMVGPALWLSGWTSAVSLAVVVVGGTPLAWGLARGRWGWLESAVRLPLVVPPAVAGVALLMAFGRMGVLGTSLAFTTAAVVLAQVFVAAPFYVQAATDAFRGVDEGLLDVAKTLGARRVRRFFAVVVPVAAPGLVSGAAMCWARALGEFGATLMFAGNLPGATQTMPLAIYTAMSGDLAAARAMSVVLMAVAFGLLWVLRWR